MRIVLADIDPVMCEAWRRDFRKYADVMVHHGSMFDVKANTIVSPANSFGFMTGGVDYVISKYLGWHVQERVQKEIRDKDCEELLVGDALWVYTDNKKYPWLISAPTMRVPSLINGTINAYLSTRAALKEAEEIQYLENFNNRNSIEIIPVFTGMGTGTGKMHPSTCSFQMLTAYEEYLNGGFKFPSSLKEESLRQRVLEG